MSQSNNGYCGRVLKIDLSSGRIEKLPLDVDLANKFIGGIGLNTYYLYKELRPHVDAFSPDNVLILGIGPLVGSGLPGSDRVEISAKSPLTNGFGSANAGGFLGIEFKKAGFDQIIIKGKAAEPVYISICDQSVSICKAKHLWGKDIGETTSRIQDELKNTNTHVMAIGQAGENLVRFANIQSDHYFSFSRGGLGAVMGSKNLKAIAVKGSSKKSLVADPIKLKNVMAEAISRVKADPLYPAMRKYGTMLFISGEVALSDGVSAEYFEENLKVKSLGCYNCPVKCSHWVKVKKGVHRGLELRGGEVAPVRSFAGPCNITSFEAIMKYTELCNKYGIDMISAASTVGWAMDCYENGLINRSDTGGLKLNKGNEGVIIDLLEMMSLRKGFGDILAEGSQRASKKIGKETEKYLLTVKGAECQVDPRLGRPGWAWCFTQAVSSRSDSAKCHPLLDFPDSLPEKTYKNLLGFPKNKKTLSKIAEWFAIPSEVKEKIFGEPPRIKWKTSKNKAMMTKWADEMSAIIDSLGICKRFSMDLFVPIGVNHYADMLSSVTGSTITSQSLMKAGERIINLQRLFNIREANVTRNDDKFPPHVYNEELNGFFYSEAVFTKALDEYYSLRGWDLDTGAPSLYKLKELGLSVETADLNGAD
jgi:aldehyde:ferredoxin oxidoreductase